MDEDIKFDFVGYWFTDHNSSSHFGIVLSEKYEEGFIKGTCFDEMGSADIAGYVKKEIAEFQKAYDGKHQVLLNLNGVELVPCLGNVIYRGKKNQCPVSFMPHKLKDIPTYSGAYQSFLTTGKFEMQPGDDLKPELLEELLRHYDLYGPINSKVKE